MPRVRKATKDPIGIGTTKSPPQRISGAVFVQKAYENIAYQERITAEHTGSVHFDKFALCAFNRIAHDSEISGTLAASILLGLPECYSGEPIQTINMFAICREIVTPLFADDDDTNIAEDLIRLQRSKALPSTLFDGYHWRGPELAQFLPYDYVKPITIVKYSEKANADISSSASHPRRQSGAQRPLRSSSCNVLIALIGALSTNETTEDAIRGSHPETNAR
ncbi:hypothetical protein MMC22_005096 [Lobaria immixta]|nr:hypothetical protein [Lobaria immixta]